MQEWPTSLCLGWSEVLIVTHWRLIACKVAKSCSGTMFSPHCLTWFTWSTEGSLYVKWQSHILAQCLVLTLTWFSWSTESSLQVKRQNHVLAQCLVLIHWLDSAGPVTKSCFGTMFSPHSLTIQLVQWQSCFGTMFSPHSLTWFSWSSDKIMFWHNV